MATDIGARIRALRTERGLSQEEVARRTGIGLKSYGDIERGRTKDPHYSTLRAVAHALSVPVQELIQEPVMAGKAEAPQKTGPLDIPDSIEELLERCGARTRYLAHPDIRGLLDESSPKKVRRIAQDVRDEKTAIADYYTRLLEYVREHPEDFAAGRFFSKLAHASLGVTLRIAARLDLALEKVETKPAEPSATDREELRDLQEAVELVGAGSL